MNPRALRYFLAVVRAGSVRGAAEALHVAPSAVSRQVAELEAHHGTALLERLPRGVAPTEAGRILAEHAERQAEEAAFLEDRLRQLRGAPQGTVRLRCGAGFLADLLENGLAGFATAHPGVSYRVALGTTGEILRAVAEGEADLGLAYNPPAHVGVVSRRLAPQPLAALLPPDHALAVDGAPRPLRAFATLPAALPPEDHGVRRLLARVEADEGFRLSPQLETEAFELQRRFVRAGLGVAFLPGFAALEELRAGQLVAVPLADPLLRHATAHLLVRAGRRLPDAVERLAAWLEGRLAVLS